MGLLRMTAPSSWAQTFRRPIWASQGDRPGAARPVKRLGKAPERCQENQRDTHRASCADLRHPKASCPSSPGCLYDTRSGGKMGPTLSGGGGEPDEMLGHRTRSEDHGPTLSLDQVRRTVSSACPKRQQHASTSKAVRARPLRKHWSDPMPAGAP